MTREVVVTVLVTLIVGDVARSSRWFAARVARWAARRIYAANAERARTREEEWEALVGESVPSDISAFCVGLSFGVFAVACLVRRRITGIVSLIALAKAHLSETPAASHDRVAWRAEEHRKASMALLTAAHGMRLCLADSMQVSPESAGDRAPRIRRLAADVQLQAANVAILGPENMAAAAAELAGDVACLADEVCSSGGPPDHVTDILDLSRLDKSMLEFQRCAVTVSRDLGDRVVAEASELHGQGANDC